MTGDKQGQEQEKIKDRSQYTKECLNQKITINLPCLIETSHPPRQDHMVTVFYPAYKNKEANVKTRKNNELSLPVISVNSVCIIRSHTCIYNSVTINTLNLYE